jgi:hypothetical protein
MYQFRQTRKWAQNIGKKTELEYVRGICAICQVRILIC